MMLILFKLKEMAVQKCFFHICFREIMKIRLQRYSKLQKSIFNTQCYFLHFIELTSRIHFFIHQLQLALKQRILILRGKEHINYKKTANTFQQVFSNSSKSKLFRILILQLKTHLNRNIIFWYSQKYCYFAIKDITILLPSI